MENNNYNLELAKYIWSILKKQIAIFMSWGVEPKSMRVIEEGLEFECNGFRHTGKVQIVLDEGKDLFEVYLISENGEKVKTVEDVFLDNLVSVVDENIEKTEDYKERICREYGITEKSMSV